MILNSHYSTSVLNVRKSSGSCSVSVPRRFEPDPFGYRSGLTATVMSGLGTNNVDVVVLNSAPPLLDHRVLRDGVRLFSRDLRATTRREGLALSRHCDFVPQRAKIDAALAGFRPATEDSS